MFSQKSSNPTLKENTFRSLANTSEEKMTLSGTINKSVILLLITISSALYMWNMVVNEGFTFHNNYAIMIGSSLFTLALAFVISFKKEWSPFLAPVYALVKGLVLGFISAIFNGWYGGIAGQALVITGTIFLVMFILYRFKVIKVTEKFRAVVSIAFTSIFLIYLVSFILHFFNIQIPYIHENGLIGIGFSVVVIIISSLNLLLDFDSIEAGIKYQAPKYMEWYSSFALLITLIWIYFETLNLLRKLYSRN